MVDRLEQGREVLRGPRLGGRRHQDEGQPSAGQTDGQRAMKPAAGRRDNSGLHGPARVGQVNPQRLDDRPGVIRGRVGDQDDADAGIGQRIALEVPEEWIVGILDHWPSAVCWNSWDRGSGGALPPDWHFVAGRGIV